MRRLAFVALLVFAAVVGVVGRGGAVTDVNIHLGPSPSPLPVNCVTGCPGSAPTPIPTPTGGIYTVTFNATPQPVYFTTAQSVILAAGAATIGSIANTAFGISGTLPAFAATPTFNCGTGCYQATQPVSGVGIFTVGGTTGALAQTGQATGTATGQALISERDELGYAMHVTTRTLLAAAAGNPSTIYAGAGRFFGAFITATGTASVTCNDNASAASGAILFTLPASPTVDTVYPPTMPAGGIPFANGITCAQGTNTPGFIAWYSK